MDSVSPIALLATLGLSPLALLMLLGLALVLSAYVKIATALSIVRFGLGVGSLPSAFITGSLALALTFFVMQPTLFKSSRAAERVLAASPAAPSDALKARALDAALIEWKGFVKTETHSDEQNRFLEIAKNLEARANKPPQAEPSVAKSAAESAAELGVEPDSWRILAPAFVVSELKEAFVIGLTLLLPFLVVDLLAANILAALGLERLSPATVAVPCKILVFIMVDGWALIAGNLVATYGA